MQTPNSPTALTNSLEPASPVARVVRFFETLQAQNVQEIAQLYAQDARFKDPFNEVKGLPAIAGIFSHMFETLENPRFVVTQQVTQGQHSFLTWEFHFGFKRFRQGQNQVILGATHLVFSPEGLVTLHRDYWDAAEELYEKLPWVGSLMHWLKRRAKS